KKDEYKKSDILFITDGYDSIHESVSTEFNKLKKEKNTKCVVILLDTHERCNEDSVKIIADKVIKLSEFGLDNTTDMIYNSIF
ncbi:MAG: hypothetical protein IJH34_11335, partial [Romboutsia sp.]|nr:hypothetical protein [Romboutsia sp.]